MPPPVLRPLPPRSAGCDPAARSPRAPRDPAGPLVAGPRPGSFALLLGGVRSPRTPRSAGQTAWVVWLTGASLLPPAALAGRGARPARRGAPAGRRRRARRGGALLPALRLRHGAAGVAHDEVADREDHEDAGHEQAEHREWTDLLVVG